MKNVLIIGLGEIGIPTAMYYKDRGCTVWGWDTDYKARMIAQALGIVVYSSFDDYSLDIIDVVSICVPTEVVELVCEQFKNHYAEFLSANRPLLFIVESTVKPGTCRHLWINVFRRNFGVAHVPQRFWGKDPKERGVRRIRVVSASDDATLKSVIRFMTDVDMPVYVVKSLEVAELSKIAENAYRYVLIAYAEELYGVCQELDVDFRAVKEAIESHKHEDYLLEPLDGIGGHCLPMAANIMSNISEISDIMRAAVKADRKYRERK